jgi:membrane protein
MGFGERYRAFDRWQQRRRPVGFTLAVLQKYSDDQGGYLAATISYYAFFSIFPLLLLFVTILGYALKGHPHLRQELIDGALGQFPVIGSQLHVHALKGNALALAVGVVGSLWAGSAVVLALENAFDTLWGVPFVRRSDFLRKRLRALLVLLLVGGGAIIATLLAGAGTNGGSYSAGFKALGILLTVALDFVLFLVAFRILTHRDVTWSDLWVGAAFAAVLWAGAQAGGTYYVTHQLKSASDVYGTFALVIGLLTWIYLGAHITLLSAEVNVVRARQLWPRSFSLLNRAPLTLPDERALDQRAQVEQRRPEERVEVKFGETDDE